MSWNEKFIGPAPKPKPQEPYGPYLPQQKQPPELLVLITQPGDDFYKLARDYFLEPRQLRRVNLHLCDPQDLKGGEALVIPLAEADMREMQSFLLKHTINNAEPRRRFGRLVPASRVDPKLLMRCTPGSGGGALTVEQLAQIVTPAAAQAAFDQVTAAMAASDVNTPARIAAFIAQIAHETGGLRTLNEDRSDESSEAKYGYQTSAGKRIGNTKQGDGSRFKGRGLIQLTGRELHARMDFLQAAHHRKQG